MSELLLEVFSGEIPARMQVAGVSRFMDNLLMLIKKAFKGNATAECWVTPRRLGVVVKNLEFEALDKELLRGPSVSAPSQALEGFLKKNNVTRAQLEEINGYYYAKLESSGEPLEDLKDVILTTLKQMVWPKSMIDGDHDLRWVRPVKSILCILDGKEVELKYHHIKSGNTTYGHRFMAPKAISIDSFVDYEKKLKDAYVILKPEDRKSSILAQANAALESLGVSVLEDEVLLDEIAGLVEYPKVFVSKINPEFMSLPREVLIITLKYHQRYLMTKKADGSLAEYHLIVANIDPTDKGVALIEGNQRVLSARLADAKFFYELDLTAPLKGRAESLKLLTFHADIGSIYDKQQSVRALGIEIAKALGLETDEVDKVGAAITLAKCDLTTNMVKEFPELQGVMGYYYAKAGGESDEVSIAIRDHYKPRGPSDRVPQGRIPSIVALADKLDTLNQMFAIGIKPTGSKDPFALRRAAIGILRILAGNDFKLNFKALGIRQDVIEFINERYEVMAG